MYEVELKFAVPDPSDVVARLSARGTSPGLTMAHCDAYFNHPSRDFAQTDEALRIRSIQTGAEKQVAITYKGPVIDPVAKTRHEIELDFARETETDTRLAEMLNLLGFRPARIVRKTRTPYRLQIAGREFEVAVDAVDELGSFVEIETLADEADRVPAREAICALAAELGLSQPERRSYLRLLIEQDLRSTSAGGSTS